MADPNEWMRDAVCASEFIDPELFFTKNSNGHLSAEEKEALEICSGCPVIVPCRAACDREERDLSPQSIFGVRGGETEKDRLRRRRVRFKGITDMRYARTAAR